jgi:hypothetical protein
MILRDRIRLTVRVLLVHIRVDHFLQTARNKITAGY